MGMGGEFSGDRGQPLPCHSGQILGICYSALADIHSLWENCNSSEARSSSFSEKTNQIFI